MAIQVINNLVFFLVIAYLVTGLFFAMFTTWYQNDEPVNDLRLTIKLKALSVLLWLPLQINILKENE